ncbi:MAG: FMN-binding glutamate synthase family protein [Pseudomonadota bacterium]
MTEGLRFAREAVEVLALLFVFALGCLLATIIVMYILDVTQSKHAIRRNFPVVGRFRYLFEHLGEFFRQYFFALDREEMPFNRAERSWVYRAAKGVDNTVAFGSTRRLDTVGTLLFVNGAYPPLEHEARAAPPVTFGPDLPHPYTSDAIINVSAMSYGAISRPAVEALSNGARMAGIWLNTGEGGVSPYHLDGGGDLIWQLGTAKFGACNDDGELDEKRFRERAAHPNIKMIEIKLSQGAKPGKGGILPGEKVTAEIAGIRGIRVGQDALSPNRHPDVSSAADLLDLVARLRDLSGKPVGLKAVIGSTDWLVELFELIRLRGPGAAPDFITVDGAAGGTGAAPLSLIDYMGLPLRESLPTVVDLLHSYGLRERIRVIASGKLITPAEVAWALCMGADFANSARGFMFSLGCIQALQCNKNTCPTGITTHDKRLQRGLNPTHKAERVRRYAEQIKKEVGIIAHSCGVSHPRLLRREHCRIVQEDGRSIPMSQLYPDVSGSLAWRQSA